MAKKKKKQVFIEIKYDDDPKDIKRAAKMLGGKVQAMQDTKTKRIFHAIVCDG